MSENFPHPPDPRQPGSDPAADRDPALSESAMAPEISRRVSSILDAVEREARRLREEAQEEARRYLDYSRRKADSLVDERRQLISDLSDEILRKSEAVLARLDDAGPVREGFENLVRSLGDAAERLARESERTGESFAPPDFHDPAVQAHEPSVGGVEPGRGAAPVERSAEPYASSTPAAAPTPRAAQPWARPAPRPPAPPHPARAPEPAAVPHVEPGRSRHAAPQPGDQLTEARTVAIQMAAAGNTRGQVREHLHVAMGIADTRRILDDVFGQSSADDARVPWTTFGS